MKAFSELMHPIEKTAAWKKLAISYYIATRMYPLFGISLGVAAAWVILGCIFQSLEGVPEWGWMFFALGVLWELIKLYKELHSKINLDFEFEFKNVFADKVRPLMRAEHQYDHEYQLLEIENQDVIFCSPKVDAYLMEAPKISMRRQSLYEKNVIDGRDYFFPILCLFLAWKVSRKPSAIFKNEKKVALLSDLVPDMTEVKVASTHYFTSQVTNDASTFQIVEGNKTLVDLTHMFPLSDKGIFQSISRSRLSNHMGVGTLSMDEDGYIIATQQGDSAQRSEGRLAPTGSGSMDWQDIYPEVEQVDFISLINRAAVRELCEEVSINDQTCDISAISNFVIGYYQWVNIGGLPQFIAISKLPASYKSLSKDKKEIKRIKVLSDKPIKTSVALSDLCSEYLDLRAQELSTPLLVTLRQIRVILEGRLGDSQRTKLIAFWQLDSTAG